MSDVKTMLGIVAIFAVGYGIPMMFAYFFMR